MLCYADHHDKAYAWAERRKLETHPKTGAAQLVEIRETVKEIVVPKYVETISTPPARPAIAKPLFIGISNDELLGYGVPVEWLNDVKNATEDSLLALTDHLPAEASEALLELATGGKPRTLVQQRIAAHARHRLLLDIRSNMPIVPKYLLSRRLGLQSSRCSAPVQKHNERRGATARSRLPMG